MNLRKVTIAILIFATLIVCSPAVRATPCTLASVKGVYGISTVGAGLNGSGQPASSVYQITADGAGNVTGSTTKSIDGSIVTFTFTGTYTIGSNCTGTATFTNQSGQTEHGNFVLDSANKGAFIIQTDANHFQSSFAVAQGTITSCTDATIAHTYAIQLSGLVVGTGQFALTGQLVLKEKTVGVTETETISGNVGLSINGKITSSIAVTGTYSVNPDCTASATITPTGMSGINWTLEAMRPFVPCY